ncbi:hypothetical protein PIB30_064475, partial [Stylosanthes scabra]|nr:hypothetical protein [Stylosanthes scabra]
MPTNHHRAQTTLSLTWPSTKRGQHPLPHPFIIPTPRHPLDAQALHQHSPFPSRAHTSTSLTLDLVWPSPQRDNLSIIFPSSSPTLNLAQTCLLPLLVAVRR